MKVRPRFLIAGSLAVGLVFTTLVAVLPAAHFAYRAPRAHAALDALEGAIALFAAYLVFGRLRETGRAREAALLYALLVSAITNLAINVAPVAIFDSRPVASIWGGLVLRLLTATAMVVAAMSAEKTIREANRKRLLAWSFGSVIVVLTAAFFWGERLPLGVSISAELGQAANPQIEGHPILLMGQLLLVALFATASVGFAVQAERTRDSLLAWLGVATNLAAFARVNYFLFPSIYTDLLYTGDVLRLGFYLAILVGALAEVRGYWRRLEATIKQRNSLIGELEEMALVDQLTGLNNRRGFLTLADQQLKLAKREGEAVSLIFIDLNNMKTINDRFGHAEGDSALRNVAAAIRKSTRESDIIARLGGDEFCVLPFPGSEDEAILAKIRQTLIVHNKEEGRRYRLALSAGVTRFDWDNPMSLDDLLKTADAAMYQEKVARKDRETILLVEDDQDLRRLIEITLSADYDIVGVETGEQALERIENDRIDLVLLDLRLPDMTGIDVVKFVRNRADSRTLPVVMLTGSADDVTEVESLRAGVDDFITKPVSEEVLRARLQTMFQRTRRG